jgi:hypothetical protein
MPDPLASTFIADTERLRKQINGIDIAMTAPIPDAAMDALRSARNSLSERLTSYVELGELFTATATHFDLELETDKPEWVGAIIRAITTPEGGATTDATPTTFDIRPGTLPDFLVRHIPLWDAHRCACGTYIGPNYTDAARPWATHLAHRLTNETIKENRNA